MPTGDPYCPKHGFAPCRCSELQETGFTEKAHFLDVEKIEQKLNAHVVLTDDVADKDPFEGVTIEVHTEEAWQHIRMTGGDPFRNLHLKVDELKSAGWTVNFANVTSTTVQLLATK